MRLVARSTAKAGKAAHARQGMKYKTSAMGRLRGFSHADMVNASRSLANHVLSQTVEYALRASIYIAKQRPRSVRGPEVAAAVNAPRNYLGKILGTLARAGYLESSRGPAGGFRLAKGSELHPLSLVVSVFEAAEPRRCLLGHGECGKNPSCTAHQRWQPIAKSTDEFFARTTLADLLAPASSAALPPQRESLRLVHNLT